MTNTSESQARDTTDLPPQDIERIDLDRAQRRELFSSRAVPSVIAASLVIIAGLYGLLECGLRIIGQPAWLIDPQSALEQMAAWPDNVAPAILGAAGAVLVIAGLSFLLSAVLPGRRARHALESSRISVVVDDEVVASVLARIAQRAAGVPSGHVRVVTSCRSVTVNVQPVSGRVVDRELVRQAVVAELERMALVPIPDVQVTVQEHGVVAA